MPSYEFQCSRCSFKLSIIFNPEQERKLLSAHGKKIPLDPETADQIDDHHLSTRDARGRFGHRLMRANVGPSERLIVAELYDSKADELDAEASGFLINEG